MISVIVAVYNAEAYLKRCIDSLLNQTYKDLEILLIDDGSVDNSLSVCKGYAEKDSRIKVFSQDNKGPAAARNVGLEKMTGDYFTVLDADDWIESDTYGCMYDIAVKENVDMVMWGYRYVSPEKEWKKDLKLRQGYYTEKECKDFTLDYLYRKNGQIPPFLWTRLIRTSVIKKHNIKFDESLKRSEDFLILYEIHKNIESMYVADEKICYNYWQNKNSITNLYVEDYWKMVIQIYNKINALSGSESESFRDRIGKMLVFRARVAIRNEKRNNNNNFFGKLKNIKKILNSDELKKVLNSIDKKVLKECFGKKSLCIKYRMALMSILLF